MIEFLCPEGHKIRCPEENAGRPAKCPKCGVGFRIPTIEELGLGESAVADDSLGGEEVTDVPVAPQSPGGSGKQVGAPSKERQIEFLCPNGHHLHGPASLQGRAGECPECRSRFRIPIVDEPVADEDLPEPEIAADQEIEAEPAVVIEDEISLDNPTPLVAPQPLEPAEALDFLQVTAPGGAGPGKMPGVSSGVGAVPAMHPLAALFIELWAARGESSRVEVHLESGSVLLPDGYLTPHSQQDYAVLVTRDPDGLSTITVVPWSSISRIILRSVEKVPGEVVR
jgi:hypothetical protein